MFLSSHIISEVERTCDRVAIIREGRIVRVDTVEGVRALAAHEVELRFAAPVAPAPFEAIEGVANLVDEGRTLRMLVTGPIAPGRPPRRPVRPRRLRQPRAVARGGLPLRVRAARRSSRRAGRDRPVSAAARRPPRRVGRPAGAGPRRPGCSASGSIFGKTFRDSRRAALLVGVITALIVVVTAAALAAEFDTVAERRRGRRPARQPPGDLPGDARRDDLASSASAASCPGGRSTSCRSSSASGPSSRCPGSSPASWRAAASTCSRPRRAAGVRIALQKLGGYLVALAVAIVAVRRRDVRRRSPRSGPCRATRSASTPSSRTRPGCSSWRSSRARSRSPSRRSSVAVAASRVGGVALFASFIVNGYSSTRLRARAARAAVLLRDHGRTTGRSPASGTGRRLAVVAARGAGPARRRASTRSCGATSSSRPAARVRLPTLPLFLAGPFSRGARRAAAGVDLLGRRPRPVRADHRHVGRRVRRRRCRSIPEIVRPDPAVLPGRGHPVGRRLPPAGLLLRGDPHRRASRRRSSSAAGRPTRASAGSSCSSAAPISPGRLGAPEQPRRHGRRRDHRSR